MMSDDNYLELASLTVNMYLNRSARDHNCQIAVLIGQLMSVQVSAQHHHSSGVHHQIGWPGAEGPVQEDSRQCSAGRCVRGP